LANRAAAQHNAPVSSNFCKELDLARFHQRAFFCMYTFIHASYILHMKSKLAKNAAAPHNASVSSNFCKELDLARFHQRAFFCPFFGATVAPDAMCDGSRNWHGLGPVRGCPGFKAIASVAR
jgi:hypothetical protein